MLPLKVTTIRRIGDRTVGSIALGTGLMAILNVPEPDAIRTIHAALDAGVRAIDSAAVYVPSVDAIGHSDRLIARAVASWDGPRDEVVHISKGGQRRIANGLDPSAFIIDGRPKSIREDVEASLKAMRTGHIDLYLLHTPDPAVPLTDSFGALVKLQREGKVRMIGLSNVHLAQIQEVSREGAVDAIENQYSVLPDYFQAGWPMTRQDSSEVLRWCETSGAAFLSYSPLGGGEQAGRIGDRLPAFGAVAIRRGVSAQRVALAWLLRQSDCLIAIAGCRRVQSAVDSARAMYLELSAAEIAELDTQLGVAAAQ